MDFDAIVLAGGRASRLDGIDKTALEFEGRTLLDLVVDAAHGSRRVIVVGTPPVSDRYDTVREAPVFGGPAAALQAALSALDGSTAEVVLVLAGDLPRVGGAIPRLLAHAAEMPPSVDGVIALDETGRRQYLTAVYRTRALRAAVAGVVAGDSMRRVIDGLLLDEVPVPTGTTHDVDTWQDAEALGITRKAVPVNEDAPRRSDDRYPELTDWNAALSEALDIPPADVERMLGLAGSAAHRVLRPAAPVTTFLVGYAAGKLVAGGMPLEEAVTRAATVTEDLLAARPSAEGA